MPLDIGQAKLADVAAWLDLTPISSEELETHKAAELAKYPAHPLYIYLRYMPQPPLLALLGIVGSGTIGILLQDHHGILALCCGAALIGFFVLMMMSAYHQHYRVYGPATWTEHDLSPTDLSYIDAPQPILDTAAHVLNSGLVDDAHLVYGKLTRQSFLLDPYLAIQRGDGDRIIIGIWDDDTILHQATLNQGNVDALR